MKFHVNLKPTPIILYKWIYHSESRFETYPHYPDDLAILHGLFSVVWVAGHMMIERLCDAAERSGYVSNLNSEWYIYLNIMNPESNNTHAATYYVVWPN